ncbi:hypothetical protein ACF8FF_23930 [Pseudomonas sp. zjy_13]|uniref:hypothetical protein n=1 Tax=Pseudomonas sp. zjy_13 TaxID=3367263 RepID=UPI00370AF3AC
MIEFYPSKLEGSPLERHRTDRVMTIEGWLQSNVPGYAPRSAPPISIEVNGVFISPDHWGKVEFSPMDTVRIYPDASTAGDWTSVFWTFTATRRDQIAFTRWVRLQARKPYRQDDDVEWSGHAAAAVRQRSYAATRQLVALDRRGQVV